ncbi:hypothetical protein GLYMA_10G161850v4 [Glycine max]|nr:hypothetical protein GLYMA_10G161850v4 [Glycine max]KAH1138555.1 hypothetical protein GYH30_028174 [Glycine max]
MGMGARCHCFFLIILFTHFRFHLKTLVSSTSHSGRKIYFTIHSWII